MAIVVAEKWGSRKWKAGKTPSVELEYVIYGTADDIAANEAILSAVPDNYAGLPYQGHTLDRTAELWWESAVTYGGTDHQGYGLVSLEFEVGTQSSKIMQSLATVAAYAEPGLTAPNFYGAINVGRNGVEGVEIEIPTYEFSETWRITDQQALGYGATLYQIAGTVNNASFRGFAPGEVLFRGANGRRTREDAWELTYRFAASPNAQGLAVGNITGISKRGWDYLWCTYVDSEDTAAMRLVKKPTAAYVEQVYRYTNFELLGIGT